MRGPHTPGRRWGRLVFPASGVEPSPASSVSPPVISSRNLTRSFGAGDMTVTAVKGVTLDVHSGEFLAITGRSGSGKTTLLNLMAGLDRPTSGSVIFQGSDLATLSEAGLVELRRSKIGFVFQSFGLMPLLSAHENVELPLHIRGTGRGTGPMSFREASSSE